MASLGMAASASMARDVMEKDPARWYAEDKSTQERWQTLVKEAHAGYRENVAQCNSMPAKERSACVKEAKATLKHDLEYAKTAAPEQ
jgi:hypothetical protein